MRSRKIEKDDIMDTIEGQATDLKETVSQTVNQAEEKLRSFYNTATDEIVETVDKVEDHIRKTPFQSSLIALVTGFVVGLIFRRS